MEKYRIVKKSRKDDENRAIVTEFFIEELVPRVFLSPAHWEEVKKVECIYHGMKFGSPRKFTTLKAAKKYYNYLLTPLPEDEVVYPPPPNHDT